MLQVSRHLPHIINNWIKDKIFIAFYGPAKDFESKQVFIIIKGTIYMIKG